MSNSITIISSKGHWRNGWLTEPKELQIAVAILEKANIKIQTVEIENVPQLEQVLDNTSKDTLIWANAYYVNDGPNKILWLNDFIEKRNLPFLGSKAQTLRNLLQKNACQSILKKANLPIPKCIIISQTEQNVVENIIAESGISFPMVLKPTAESGSVGITMAKGLQEACQKVKKILRDFPHSQVIIEQFLPSDDITCGFLQLGERVLLLPTYYIVRSADGKHHILERYKRLRKWDEGDKLQLPVTDPAILKQLKNYIPKIVKTLDIQNITRIDGRLDENGMLRYFDVNGLPALDFPDSVMDKQCFTCFPDYSSEAVYEGLLHTIIANAFMRYNMEVPARLLEHNLFTMKSEVAIRI